MPISRAARALYPENWETLSRSVKDAAGWRCEACGVQHMAWGWRDAAQTFHELDRKALYEAGYRKTPFAYPLSSGLVVKVIEIVLTTAHVNHDVTDNSPENLKCWCQLHHLAHDAPHHQRNAARTRRAAMKTPDLLESQAAI